jgi:DnaJ like chaperone protein
MSLWEQIRHFFRDIRAHGFVALFERLRGDPHKSLAFTIAVVALGAKMAKADGLVTHDEVVAFREVFRAEARAEHDIARLFNLARQDIAGFQAYAYQVRRLFPDPHHSVITDLVEGLFYIAMADGKYHPHEDAYLEQVATILGLPQATFETLRARSAPLGEGDPYQMLGVSRDMETEAIHAVWKQIVRNCHPDSMRARGLPDEAIGIAERRLQAVNRAWDDIRKARA